MNYLNSLLLLAQGSTVTASETNYYIMDGLIVVAGVGLVLFAVCRSSLRR